MKRLLSQEQTANILFWFVPAAEPEDEEEEEVQKFKLMTIIIIIRIDVTSYFPIRAHTVTVISMAAKPDEKQYSPCSEESDAKNARKKINAREQQCIDSMWTENDSSV